MEKDGHSVAEETAHAVAGWGAIALTYNWLAHFVNLLAGALMPGREQIAPMLFDYPLAGGHLFPIFWPVLVCILVGFITYIVLRLVCSFEWVKATYVIAHCWRINPFGIIFCVFKVISVWILRIVCRWVAYIIAVPIWFCFVIWIWRLF